MLSIGISSASCGSSFAILSCVLTSFRHTMLHESKKNLVILVHERVIANSLDMDDFG